MSNFVKEDVERKGGAKNEFFVARPCPEHGELLDSYISRLLRLNGFTQLRGLTPGSALARESKLEFLQRYTALQKSELGKLMDPDHVVLEAKEDRKLFLTARVRWCPRCVAERPTFLGHWVFRTTVVCIKHRSFLLDECPSCHRPQTARAIPGRCECGFALTYAHEEIVPDPLYRLQQGLYQSLFCEGQRSIFGLDYFRAAKLAHYLGVLACGSRKQSLQENAFSRRVVNDRILMTAAADLIDNWPNSFQTLLALRQTVQPTQSVRRDFGTVYDVLYRCLKGVEYQFVRDLFERFVNKHWKGTLTRRNASFSEDTLTDHPRVTLGKAAVRLGTTPAVLRRLAATVGMSEVGKEQGRKCATVEVGRLPRVRGETLQAAARLLHIPKRRVRMLLEAGVIEADISPTRSSAAAWFISREQLTRFMLQTTVCQCDDFVTFGHVIKYGKLSEEEFLDLVEKLITGELLPSSDSGGTVPIGSVKLARSAVRRWREQLQRDNYRHYSVDGAAKLLGIKQQVAYHLVRTGLLGSVRSRDNRSVQVRPSDLQSFMAEYVSLVSLAREQGTVSKVLRTRLPCAPVTGPDIDGGRQYFYRRADLNEWICNGGDHDGR